MPKYGSLENKNVPGEMAPKTVILATSGSLVHSSSHEKIILEEDLQVYSLPKNSL